MKQLINIAVLLLVLVFTQCTPKITENTTTVNEQKTKVIDVVDHSWRAKAPSPATARPIELGKYSSFTLDNGLKVIVVESHKLPTVRYQLILDNDPILEKGQVGYASMAGELLGRGTKTRSKADIDKAIDYIGASLNTSQSGLFGRSLKKHSDKLLEMMSDILLNPSFPKTEFDKIKKQTLSGIESSKANPNAMAANVSSVLNFGTDHPYGEVQTEEAVNNISIDKCKDYYNTYFKPNNAYLVVVGDIDVPEAKANAEKYFGSWKRGVIPTVKHTSPKEPSISRVAVVNKEGAVQSVIRVTYPVDLKPGAEDLIKARVMNNILGGGIFSGRLMQNLREDKAYTYGSRSSLSSDKLVGAFRAAASVRNEVTDSSVHEILYEMRRMVDEPVTEQDLATVKSSMAGGFGRSLESPETMARFAVNTFKYNLPADYYATYLQKLDAVTIADVQAMAKKYIRPENANIVVVGSKSDIGDKLNRFDGDGKIEYFDAFGKVKKYDAVSTDVTAQGVIDAYIKAIGGKQKLVTIKTMEQTVAMNFMGQVATTSEKIKYPNKYMSETSMMGQVMEKQVFDGNKVKFYGGTGEGEVIEDKKMIASMQESASIFPQLYYSKTNVKLEGIEEIEGKKAYKLVVKSSTGPSSYEYYDTQSGYLVRKVVIQEMQGQKMTMTTDYTDYKSVEGIMFPYSYKIAGMMPTTIDAEVKELKLNSKLSDELFMIK